MNRIDQQLTKNSRSKKFFLKLKRHSKKNMERGRFDLINQLIWITPALIFVLLFTVYAIFIVFRDGFNGSAITNNFLWSLRNFELVVQDPSFTASIGNSFLYVLI